MKTGDGETHREFESHTLRQEMPSPYGGGISYSVRFEGSNAMRTSIAADGLTEANNYFRIMRKCKRISHSPPVKTPSNRMVFLFVFSERTLNYKLHGCLE